MQKLFNKLLARLILYGLLYMALLEAADELSREDIKAIYDHINKIVRQL